jgi:hypothetical protein
MLLLRREPRLSARHHCRTAVPAGVCIFSASALIGKIAAVLESMTSSAWTSQQIGHRHKRSKVPITRRRDSRPRANLATNRWAKLGVSAERRTLPKNRG